MPTNKAESPGATRARKSQDVMGSQEPQQRVRHHRHICANCHELFEPKTQRGKYCSNACRVQAWRVRHLDVLKRGADPKHIWVELTPLGKRLQKMGMHVIEPVPDRKTEYFIVRHKKRKYIKKIVRGFDGVARDADVMEKITPRRW